MILILDASAALEVTMKHSKARGFVEYIRKAKWVIAPDIAISEIANALWKYCNFEGLSVEDSKKILEWSINLVDDYIPSLDLYLEAYALAVMNRHPVYDALYLSVARRFNGTLLTRDKELINIANKLKIQTIK